MKVTLEAVFSCSIVFHGIHFLIIQHPETICSQNSAHIDIGRVIWSAGDIADMCADFVCAHVDWGYSRMSNVLRHMSEDPHYVYTYDSDGHTY